MELIEWLAKFSPVVSKNCQKVEICLISGLLLDNFVSNAFNNILAITKPFENCFT